MNGWKIYTRKKKEWRIVTVSKTQNNAAAHQEWQMLVAFKGEIVKIGKMKKIIWCCYIYNYTVHTHKKLIYIPWFENKLIHNIIQMKNFEFSSKYATKTPYFQYYEYIRQVKKKKKVCSRNEKLSLSLSSRQNNTMGFVKWRISSVRIRRNSRNLK